MPSEESKGRPEKLKKDKEAKKKAKKPVLIEEQPITEASVEESAAQRQSPQGFDKVANFFKNLFTVCGTDGGCCASRPSPSKQ